MTPHASNRNSGPIGAEEAQCESCGGVYPYEEMETKTYPGAELAFCQDCVAPTKAEEYGVKR